MVIGQVSDGKGGVGAGAMPSRAATRSVPMGSGACRHELYHNMLTPYAALRAKAWHPAQSPA
ncbi:MAG: hypothetical protein KAV00_03585, partial [Phycisphaerae bacterium]|nr:hypothetical protein [Phycisphaerae bacterium]